MSKLTGILLAVFLAGCLSALLAGETTMFDCVQGKCDPNSIIVTVPDKDEEAVEDAFDSAPLREIYNGPGLGYTTIPRVQGGCSDRLPAN